MSPVNVADNPSKLRHEHPASYRGRTRQPWPSHEALLGRSWWGKREFLAFFMFLTLSKPLLSLKFLS